MDRKKQIFFCSKIDEESSQSVISSEKPPKPRHNPHPSGENNWDSLNQMLGDLKNNQGTKIQKFISNPLSKSIIASEKPIKAALSAGNFLVAEELKQKGFKVSPSLIFDAICIKDQKSIENIIKYNFYSEDSLQLAFWYLLFNGFTQSAHDLFNQNAELKTYYTGTSFIGKRAIESILQNYELMDIALDQALEFAVDDAACCLIRKNFKLANLEKMRKGLEKGCVNLMRILGSGDLDNDIGDIVGCKIKSPIWDHLENDMSGKNELKNVLEMIKPVNLLNYYMALSMPAQCQKIIRWPIVKNDPNILQILLHNSTYTSLSEEFILNTNIKLNTEIISSSLEAQKYTICNTILCKLPFHLTIKSIKIQRILLNLLENSQTCILAIEMLNRITLRSWHFELTRELCLKLANFIKKKKEILYCPSPLLFCVLASELMIKFSNYSRQFKGKCLTVSELYINLASSIEDSISNEQTLKHYLTQTDTKNRSVLEIIAKNQFYDLLSKDNVGLIVTKLWIGSENYYGVHKASSIVATALAPEGSDESLQFRFGIDKTKPYSFQFEQWIQACSNRFTSYGISILALIILYQVFLYLLIANGTLVHSGSNPHETELFGLILTMIFGISCEQILKIIHQIKTKGKIKINMWQINDWLIGVLIIFISIEIPHKLYLDGKISFDRAYLSSGVIYSIMLFMLCMKYVNIILTSQSFGPFLSMVLLIFKEIYKFLLILAGFALCSSSIFTLLFDSTPGYQKLDFSLRTLFMATIGPFTIDSFTENKLAFGAVMLALFLLLGHVLLLNLLVGIVTNVFNVFQSRIESQHRAVIINTYYKNLWDEDYGMLNFLPTPFNAVSLLLSPLVLGKNNRIWNKRITKVLYLFYAVPYFFIFVICSLLALPLAYLQGFIVYGKTGIQVPLKRPVIIFDIPTDFDVQMVTRFSYRKSFLWTFIGIPWLLYALVRDSYQFWVLAYLESPNIKSLGQRSIVDQNFIRNFQKTLKVLKTDTVTCDQFFKTFQQFNRITSPEENYERSEEIIGIIRQFSAPWADGVIELNRIKEIFVKKFCSLYDTKYIESFAMCNFPWIYKGLASFQRQNGKSLNKKNQVDRNFKLEFDDKLAQVENIVVEQKRKIRKILKDCRQIFRNTNKKDN